MRFCFAGARAMQSSGSKMAALPVLGSSTQVGQRNKNYSAQSKSRFTFSPHGSWQPEQQCLHDGHRRIVMSNSIVITVPHRLGAKEAKRRIAEQIELFRRHYIDNSPIARPIGMATRRICGSWLLDRRRQRKSWTMPCAH